MSSRAAGRRVPVRSEPGLPQRRAAPVRVPRLEERSARCPGQLRTRRAPVPRPGAELGACSGPPGARERTQERRRPAPAPGAEPLRRSPEQLPPSPPAAPGEGDQKGGNPDWTLQDPLEGPEA
ncbi:hypothetical protein MC885_003475 [Smutsia gigantea]|nr:hypothetical protein MC885_003475 [Smutsia gigantea]